MIAPICVPCKRQYRCVKNGFPVKDPAVGNCPSTYWRADKWKCPNCRHEVVSGFSGEISENAMRTIDPDEMKVALEFQYS